MASGNFKSCCNAAAWPVQATAAALHLPFQASFGQKAFLNNLVVALDDSIQSYQYLSQCEFLIDRELVKVQK